VRARDRMREIDKKNEITLRKKYHLYAESSDIETNNNNSRFHNHNQQPSTSRATYQDYSLPSQLPQRESNVPDSVKLEDLHATSQGHRRTSSDSSKDKKAGAFVHVRNKKKAPLPPLDLRSTSTTPKTSSGRRRKRQAPPPPLSPTTRVLEEASSATSLLGDKEIQALIQGTTSLVKSTTTVSSPIIVLNSLESPIMEKKKIYVSPYLKIREDRKLTDEQKRLLLEQVTKNQRRSEEQLTTAQRSQFDFPKAKESPKITKDDKDKIFAPSSPISPRPWYKRSSATNGHKETIPFKKEVFLRTLEKKKSKKEDKDLPEVGYSRNSFFDTASKFNINWAMTRRRKNARLRRGSH
jgi:RanBP-type and C3HC4-type zinc finger-containing protein 1